MDTELMLGVFRLIRSACFFQKLHAPAYALAPQIAVYGERGPAQRPFSSACHVVGAAMGPDGR
jgi:hypothetical protein